MSRKESPNKQALNDGCRASTDTMPGTLLLSPLEEGEESSLFCKPNSSDTVAANIDSPLDSNQSPKKESPKTGLTVMPSNATIEIPVQSNTLSYYSISKKQIAVNIGIMLFSALVSFYYGVLAFLRGEGNVGLSWMLAGCAFFVNFPQYIFVPQTLMDRIKDVFKYGLYAPYLISGSLGMWGGILAFLSGEPLGVSAAQKIVTSFDISLSPAMIKSISIPFALAIGLTRALGTWSLSFMFYNAFLLKHLNSNRYFLSLVLSDLQKYPAACPQGNVIDDDWINDFYNNALQIRNLNQQTENNQSSWVTPKNAATFLLMAGCLPLIPMWLGLAQKGSSSDNRALVWSTGMQSENFYLWFCFTLLGKLINLTHKMVNSFKKSEFSAFNAWFFTAIIEGFILGSCFASGGGYAATARGQQHDGFGSVAEDTVLSWAGRPLYFTEFYTYLVMFYAGFVANGGAVFAMSSKYADQKTRFDQIPEGITWGQSILETTFQSGSLPKQLPLEVQNVEACKTALTYFKHQITLFDDAKQKREEVMDLKRQSLREELIYPEPFVTRHRFSFFGTLQEGSTNPADRTSLLKTKP